MIFGAGASIPFFMPQLTTAYLTAYILDKTNWDIVLKMQSHISPNDLTISSEEVISVLRIIKEINPYFNFEQLAEIMDKIASISFDDNPQNNMLNALFETMIRTKKIESIEKFNYWKNIPFLFRMIIANAILDLQQNHKTKNYQELIDIQHYFIKDYIQNDNASIVSFNYDDILLESVKMLGFENGFKKLDNRGRRLDIKILNDAHRAIYFPHGHLTFNFLDDINVECFSDSQKAHDARMVDISTLCEPLTITQGKFAYNFNTFITTGQTKDDSLNLMPYSFYYQKLASDLLKSTNLVLIGYSFGDEHLNRLLVSNLQLNSKNTILIVDYYLENITLIDEYRNQECIIFKIQQYFKTVLNLHIVDNEMFTDRPEDVKQINQEGYGMLFPRIYYYKKGYENFLMEYSDVLEYCSKRHESMN